MAEWLWHRTSASFAECGHHFKWRFSYSRIAGAEQLTFFVNTNLRGRMKIDQDVYRHTHHSHNTTGN
ncbi:hypothetical protein TNIN_391341 [Trichonephila inaurata madagascariensis]|uniref:Uncharacterized protein n=1 Tax=Trichonephila inaurata madagascariensis TaxID=2747483 RepID=A0A8X6XQY8_9ARAC|nr:hypothetical protein TNIN_391341 [Trichonephila inaurata madagascariensis]